MENRLRFVAFSPATSAPDLSNRKFPEKGRSPVLSQPAVPLHLLPDDTLLVDLAWPCTLLARLELIGVRTLSQFRVLLSMRDKTRSQLVTTLRHRPVRSPLQKTKRPGLV
jgi:hypothetical protein